MPTLTRSSADQDRTVPPGQTARLRQDKITPPDRMARLGRDGTVPPDGPDGRPVAAGDVTAGLATPGSGLRGHPALLRRARLAALALGGFLLPWCVLLAAILPATAQAQHWPLAWVGLDGAEAVAALATAALLSRADIRASLTAAAAGTLLFIDAWFDVCTSAPGTDHALALAEATFVEGPTAIAAWWLALTLLRRTRVRPALLAAAAAGTLAAATAALLGDRAPFPYAQRRLLDVPLPLLTGRRLDALLRPRAGEQILEIGPGTGLQSLHVAPQLGSEGQLCVLDIQQQMLDHVMARAAQRSITNISPHLASAGALPFGSGRFDAAYLVTVLGETPVPLATLTELRRVLKPGGRLVVGEFADRHHVTLATLARLANDAGLHLRRRTGVPFAYYALLTPCRGADQRARWNDRPPTSTCPSATSQVSAS